jgi:hypothetical protein
MKTEVHHLSIGTKFYFNNKRYMKIDSNVKVINSGLVIYVLDIETSFTEPIEICALVEVDE